jgi:hypothetical protein
MMPMCRNWFGTIWLQRACAVRIYWHKSRYAASACNQSGCLQLFDDGIVMSQPPAPWYWMIRYLWMAGHLQHCIEGA